MELWTENCAFCGKKIKKGAKKVFIKSDGAVQLFCSSKCKSKFTQPCKYVISKKKGKAKKQGK